MVKGQWQLSILEKGQVFQVKWDVDSVLVKTEESPLISKYLRVFFFFFSPQRDSVTPAGTLVILETNIFFFFVSKISSSHRSFWISENSVFAFILVLMY